MTLYPL